MDIKNQMIQEYLSKGCGFRTLADKYGISRTTICKWVAIHQGIHNLPPTAVSSSVIINSNATGDVFGRTPCDFKLSHIFSFKKNFVKYFVKPTSCVYICSQSFLHKIKQYETS